MNLIKTALLFLFASQCYIASGQSASVGEQNHLIFHDIRVDGAGKIIPWSGDDPGKSYDSMLNSLWRYWKYMPSHWVRSGDKMDNEWKSELKFPPKYLIFRTLEDQGIAGDQFAAMLHSFDLYYNYSGDKEVLENMVFQANWYLKHSLSPANAEWPNIPFPCNTEEAPIYDGDLILGKGITQPDKAGSFAAELVMLFKKTNERRFLDAAVNIANTLSSHTKTGDYDNSPLPFKVNALTGEIKSTYTSNWTGTLQLYSDLIQLGYGETSTYQKSYDTIIEWLKTFPMKNNRWGPFFEDIKVWSDTEINEGKMALFILDHTDDFPNWKGDVRKMQDWALETLGIAHWKQYGCRVMGEQSVYKMQGQSHTARHASIELLYSAKTGDSRNRDEAVSQLNFCTYAVDVDGKSRWMNFDTYEIWWTDGYGDFICHFIRAMSALPEVAPSDRPHILNSTSVITNVVYGKNNVSYSTFGLNSSEIIRVLRKPSAVRIDGRNLSERNGAGEIGFAYKKLSSGGIVYLKKENGKNVSLIF